MMVMYTMQHEFEDVLSKLWYFASPTICSYILSGASIIHSMKHRNVKTLFCMLVLDRETFRLMFHQREINRRQTGPMTTYVKNL